MSEAYRSVVDISFKVRAGLVMRQIHHWAAVVFLAAIVVHLCRIFFTGAFRRPRELNWIVGVTLLILAMGNGFTGYSLPDDLLSGTGLRIMYSIVLSIPFIGSWFGFLFFGGTFPGTEIIQRLFIIHVFFIPALIAVILTVHLAILWHQKHTDFPGPGKSEDTITAADCGRSTQPSRSPCSASWRPFWPAWVAWPRSTRSGSTGPTVPRR